MEWRITDHWRLLNNFQYLLQLRRVLYDATSPPFCYDPWVHVKNATEKIKHWIHRHKSLNEYFDTNIDCCLYYLYTRIIIKKNIVIIIHVFVVDYVFICQNFNFLFIFLKMWKTNIQSYSKKIKMWSYTKYYSNAIEFFYLKWYMK